MIHQLCAIILLACAASPASAVEWRLRAGTDVIGERFRLIETDTLDFTTEYRGELETFWTHSGQSWRDVRVDNRFGIGNLAARHDFDMRGTWHAAPTWSVEFDALTSARHYLDAEDSIRSDLAEGSVGVVLRRTDEEQGLSFGIDQGIEGLAYERTTSVYLDAARHWHGFVFNGQHGFDYFGGRAIFEREVVPDSTGLGFSGLATDAYGLHSLSPDWSVSGDGAVYYRRYRDTATHPHTTDLTGSARIEWRYALDWSAEASLEGSRTSYTPADSTYYDLRYVQPSLEFVWWPAWGQVRGGPHVGWQRSSTLAGEKYMQWGGRVGANLFSLRHGFLDATLTVGRRDYADDDEAIFSDYTYYDGTIVLTANLPWGFEVDTFVLIRTEDHRDSGDNSTSVLLTVDLSRRLW